MLIRRVTGPSFDTLELVDKLPESIPVALGRYSPSYTGETQAAEFAVVVRLLVLELLLLLL